MGKLFLGGTFVLLMAGCTISPLRQCQAPFGRDLADVETELATVEANIRRGYTLAPAQVSVGVKVCTSPITNVSICAGGNRDVNARHVAIDLTAERAKLATLQARQAELEANLAQCARTFPAS